MLDRAMRGDMFAPMHTLARQPGPIRHAVDVVETKEDFKVVTDAPGFSADDIKVELHEGKLTVSGERKLEKAVNGDEGKYHMQERQWTKFSRQFQLPANIAEDRVAASLDKGILTVTVPKVPEPPKAQPKRIQVISAL